MKLLLVILCLSITTLAQARPPLQHDVFELVSRGQLSAPKIAQHLHFLLEAGKLSALHGAVVLRDAARLQQLIRAGLDVNAQGSYQEWSPLHVAVLMDDPVAIKILLEAGAKTDVLDINHDYPTGMAAQWGHTNSLRTLIATTGLPPPDNHGTTLLHRAVSGDNTETVAYLLDRDDVTADVSDRRGATPLMFARSVTVAEQLLAAGADLNKKEEELFFSPISYTAYRGDAKLLQFFLDREPDLLFNESSIGTPFLIAAKFGFTNIAQDLLARGANVEDKDRFGQGVLQIIVNGESTSHELFAAMLDKVADINATDNYGENIAHAVARKNDAGLFDLLLHNKQVNLNMANFQGHTPLTSAAVINKSTSAAILVQHGAQLSPKTNAGLTAFLLAVQRNAVETATALLEKGGKAQLQHHDSHDNNALQVLIGAYLSPRFLEDRDSFNRLLALLVEHGLDIDSTDAQGNSILHKVAAAGKIEELLDIIYKHGGDHTRKNADGKTIRDISKDMQKQKTN